MKVNTEPFGARMANLDHKTPLGVGMVNIKAGQKFEMDLSGSFDIHPKPGEQLADFTNRKKGSGRLKVCPHCEMFYDDFTAQKAWSQKTPSYHPMERSESFENQGRFSQSNMLAGPSYTKPNNVYHQPGYYNQKASSGNGGWLDDSTRESVGSNKAPIPRGPATQVKTRVPPSNVMVNKWVRNSAMVLHPKVRKQSWARRNRFGGNPPLWNENYQRGHLTQGACMTGSRLTGPSNQPPMTKSQKRRLQRLRQAQKKKMLELEGIQIKELPTNETGCLFALKEGLSNARSEDKLKSGVVEL